MGCEASIPLPLAVSDSSTNLDLLLVTINVTTPSITGFMIETSEACTLQPHNGGQKEGTTADAGEKFIAACRQLSEAASVFDSDGPFPSDQRRQIVVTATTAAAESRRRSAALSLDSQQCRPLNLGQLVVARPCRPDRPADNDTANEMSRRTEGTTPPLVGHREQWMTLWRDQSETSDGSSSSDRACNLGSLQVMSGSESDTSSSFDKEQQNDAL